MSVVDVKDRKGFIGGSDVAGILNIPMFHENGERARWSPTPWSVWAETVGLVTDDREGDTERMDIGLDAEQFLATVYERHHPDLWVNRTPSTLLSDDYPFLKGHADGFIHERITIPEYPDLTIKGEPIAGWEAKTSNDLHPWDQIPAFYQCQAQTYMILSGLPEWHFTVGFARWNIRHYIVEADLDDQALIIATVQQFWDDHVVTGIPPSPDAYPATTDAIKHAYSDADPDDSLEADDELARIHARLIVARNEIKRAEELESLLVNELKAAMGGHAQLVHDGATLATWKPQTARRFDIPAFINDHPDLAAEYMRDNTFRVFRPKPIKENPT